MGRAGHSLTGARRPYIRAGGIGLKRDRMVDTDSNKRMRYAPRTVTRSRRRPRYRRSKYRRRQFIPRALTPHSKMIRVRATELITQSAHTAGALVMTPLQLNSFDDPFTTSGAGQPLGYDQWKALYKKAFVVSSKITVKAVNRDSSEPIMVGVTPMPLSQAATALASYEHYMEYPSTKSYLLTPDMDHMTFFHKVSVKRHMHLNKLRDVDEIRVDLVNETAPADLCYWHLWSQPVQQSADMGSVDLVTTMEYIVVLIDPVVPSRSVET